MSSTPGTERFRFADFEFDPRIGELSRSGRRIALRPQAATVLEVLVRRPDELVTREELQEAVWGDTAVDAEAGLNHCVRQVRRALGENAATPRLLETIPRRGYRFLGEVTRVAVGPTGAGSGSAVPAVRHESRRWLRAAAAVVVALALIATPWLIGGEPGGAASTDSVADSPDFVRALWLLAQGDPASATRARPLLESVVTEHPRFAAGHAALARALAFSDSGTDIAVVRSRVALALELDPELPSALVMNSYVRVFADHDYAGAEADLRRAVALEPDAVDPLHHLAALLSLLGRHDEALTTMHQALQLDPVSPLLAGDLAWFYLTAGRWAEAVSWAERTLALDPDWRPAHAVRLHATSRLGDLEATRILVHAALERGGAEADRVSIDGAADPLAPIWRWWLANVDRGDSSHAMGRAMALAGLGRKAEALDALEMAEAAGDRGLLALIRDVRLEPLREHARFHALLGRLGLAPAYRGDHSA